MNRITRTRKHRARMNEQAVGREAHRLLKRARHPKPEARTTLNWSAKRLAASTKRETE